MRTLTAWCRIFLALVAMVFVWRLVGPMDMIVQLWVTLVGAGECAECAHWLLTGEKVHDPQT